MSLRENSDGSVFGSGPDPNDPAGPHTVGLTASTYIRDPNQGIMQAGVRQAFFSGAQGPNCGSLQADSAVAQVWLDGQRFNVPLLGLEVVGSVTGAHAGSIQAALGLQVSQKNTGETHNDHARTLRLIGPSTDGVATIGEGITLEIWQRVGPAVVIIDSTQRKRLVVDGATVTGYGSDGRPSVTIDLETGTVSARKFVTAG